jgi:hypothetical protein
MKGNAIGYAGDAVKIPTPSVESSSTDADNQCDSYKDDQGQVHTQTD